MYERRATDFIMVTLTLTLTLADRLRHCNWGDMRRACAICTHCCATWCLNAIPDTDDLQSRGVARAGTTTDTSCPRVRTILLWASQNFGVCARGTIYEGRKGYHDYLFTWVWVAPRSICSMVSLRSLLYIPSSLQPCNPLILCNPQPQSQPRPVTSIVTNPNPSPDLSPSPKPNPYSNPNPNPNPQAERMGGATAHPILRELPANEPPQRLTQSCTKGRNKLTK